MGALHIISNDFKLGFGINAGLVGDQQAATQLACIRPLRFTRDLNNAIENTATTAISNSFMQLLKGAVRAVESNGGVGICKLMAANELQRPEARMGSSLLLAHLGLAE